MRSGLTRPARRLIVNADGFGFGPGATKGIFEAVEGGGPITSISVNANFREVERLSDFTRRFPQISVGVHLNPIVGSPCLSADRVPTLVGATGEFHGTQFEERWRRKEISLPELEAEFDAQIEKAQALTGGRVTHLDSQEHSHLHYFDLFLRIAGKWRIRCLRTNASLIGLEACHPTVARWRAYLHRPHVCAGHAYRRIQMARAVRRGFHIADALVSVGYAGRGNKTVLENWVNVIRNLPAGTFEMFCHPGYPDAVLRRWSTTYAEPRSAELAILRTPFLREIAAAEGVDLIGFHQIAEA